MQLCYVQVSQGGVGLYKMFHADLHNKHFNLACKQTALGCCCAFADGITLGLAERAGVFRLAQYGPINSLSIRKNEVLLAVQL